MYQCTHSFTAHNNKKFIIGNLYDSYEYHNLSFSERQHFKLTKETDQDLSDIEDSSNIFDELND